MYIRTHKQTTGVHLVLVAGFDGLDDLLTRKAQLDDLVHHLGVDEGSRGHGVRLDHCQVARQVLAEPGMLPAPPPNQTPCNTA